MLVNKLHYRLLTNWGRYSSMPLTILTIYFYHFSMYSGCPKMPLLMTLKNLCTKKQVYHHQMWAAFIMLSVSLQSVCVCVWYAPDDLWLNNNWTWQIEIIVNSRETFHCNAKLNNSKIDGSSFTMCVLIRMYQFLAVYSILLE